MNKIENKLKAVLKKALESLSIEVEESMLMVEIPKDSKNGDYSTNLAMRLSKQLRNNPREIAGMLQDELVKESYLVDKVEVAGPGFLNIWVNNLALTSVINDVINQKNNYYRFHYSGY